MRDIWKWIGDIPTFERYITEQELKYMFPGLFLLLIVIIAVALFYWVVNCFNKKGD